MSCELGGVNFRGKKEESHLVCMCQFGFCLFNYHEKRRELPPNVQNVVKLLLSNEISLDIRIHYINRIIPHLRAQERATRTAIVSQ